MKNGDTHLSTNYVWKKLITKIDSDLDIDLYIKSTKFLIKAIGYNYVQKPTPNEFHNILFS